MIKFYVCYFMIAQQDSVHRCISEIFVIKTLPLIICASIHFIEFINPYEKLNLSGLILCIS